MYLQIQLMPRELWVHPLHELHEEKGEFYTLYPDLRHFPTRFFRMYRMSVNKFDKLLAELSPELLKKDITSGRPSLLNISLFLL